MTEENVNVDVVTPKFRGAFVTLLKPKQFKKKLKKDGTPMEGFQITMLFDEGETLAGIKAAATELMTAKFGPKENGKWPKPASAKNPQGYTVPWRDQAEKDPDNDEAEKTYEGFTAGRLYINAKAYTTSREGKPLDPPWVVDTMNNPIIDVKQVYSGAYYQAAISLYWYNQEGNKGIGIGLVGVRKVEDGEPLGGKRKGAADYFSPTPVSKSKAAAAAFADEDDEDGDDPLA